MFIRRLPALRGVGGPHVTGRIFFVRNCTFLFFGKKKNFQKFFKNFSKIFFVLKFFDFRKKKCRFIFSEIFVRTDLLFFGRTDGHPVCRTDLLFLGLNILVVNYACVTGRTDLPQADGPPPHTP